MGSLRLGRAVALGALHGPAELLPISSSGHVTLAGWLLGWDLDAIEPDLRKTFEVALHAGTAAALLLLSRAEIAGFLREGSPRRAFLALLSLAPPAAAGLAFEGPIERRLGTPASVSCGLIAGGVAMAAADRARQARGPADAGAADALWLGIAQACALAPGISRGGATLTAARARGFTRPAAVRLSGETALPVILAASGLKAVRLRRRGLPADARLPLAAGALASFASALATGRLIARRSTPDRPLRPYAAYRVALGATVLGLLRSAR